MIVTNRLAGAAYGLDLCTSAPAFAVNEDHRIVSWNDAARRLLGFDASEVLGRTCAEIVACPFAGDQARCFHAECSPCGDTSEAERSLAVYDRCVRRKDGKTIWVGVTTVLARSESSTVVLHLLRDLTREMQLEQALKDVAALVARASAGERADGEAEGAPPDAADLLTPREIEVLRYLHDGADTVDIAAALFVSPATVRNHVQSVLRKLRARSRLEAVSLAVKNGML